MADPPDREQVEAALRRAADIVKRAASTAVDIAGRAASAAISVGLVLMVVLVGLVIAAFVFDPLLLEAAADSPGQLASNQPWIIDAASGSGACVETAQGNATATNHQFLSVTSIAVTGNVSLPNASYVLSEPTITEQPGHRYILNVSSHPTNTSTRECQGVARYSAKIQLPYGVTDYELIVRHDGNRTLRKFNA